MTRMPFARLLAMLLAIELLRPSHAEQFMNSVSPSSHWPELRLYVRVDDAIVKFTTVDPLAMVRSSGSRVRLPTTVITVSPAMITYLPMQLEKLEITYLRRIFVRMTDSFRFSRRSSSSLVAGSAE